MINTTRQLIAAFVLALLLASGAGASNPPANLVPPPANGDRWVSFSGQNFPTCDDLIDTQSLGYESVVVWQYSSYYHSWQYAPQGTQVTLSCNFLQPSGWDDLWPGGLGSNTGGTSITVSVGTNGQCGAPFAGVADNADRVVVYKANSGTTQRNPNESFSAVLKHSRFLDTDSHVTAVYPPEEFNVHAASVQPVWDGKLVGHTPDANHKFQLVAFMYDEAGGLVWISDTWDRYNTDDADVRLFGSDGAHLTDMVPAWDRPVPNLLSDVGHDMLLIVKIEESDYSFFSGWSPWTTLKTAGGQDVAAERLIHIVQ